MKVEYAVRAVRDLTEIGAYYRTAADERIAAAVGEQIARIIHLVAREPHIAPRLTQRPDVRVVLVLRYPYKIFYRVHDDVVEILHVRHTARRPWGEN